MTKVVVSGYYGYENFGDELILDVLSTHLKSLNADITVLSGNPKYTKNRNKVESINRFDIKQVISKIKSSEVLISGGGSLLQDVTSLKSLVYYLFIISLGILFNKKVIIFAQGIGPINNNFAKFMTKLLLKQCYYVSVRDEKSYNLLKSWDIVSEIVPDPVFSINVSKTGSGGVGIQLRNFHSVSDSFLKSFAMFINEKFSDKTIKLFSLQKTFDFELCNKFKNLFLEINPNIKIEIVTDNLIEEISNLEYLFAMRFHALLIAIKAGVKSCAINYDIKVESLAKEYSLPLISLSDSNDYEKIYNDLLKIEYKDTSNKIFNWSNFDEILKSC